VLPVMRWKWWKFCVIGGKYHRSDVHHAVHSVKSTPSRTSRTRFGPAMLAAGFAEMIGAEEPPHFLATRLPRRWRPGIARWHPTPTCSMVANCAAINAWPAAVASVWACKEHGSDHGKFGH
jgi:hypothetical protein